MGSVRDREGGGSTLSRRHCLVSCGVGKGQGGRGVHTFVSALSGVLWGR